LDLDTAVKRLRDTGLFVSEPSKSSEESWAKVHFRVAKSREVNNEFGCELVNYPSLSMISYERRDNSRSHQWEMRRWDWTPGPGKGDFVFESAHLEVIVNAVLNWYFGEPMILCGWIVPVDKHPEWDAKRLPQVLKSAKEIPLDDWKVIEKTYGERRIKLHGTPATLTQIFSGLFNTIHHSEDSSLTLYLRRDLEEAFIVRRG
jgi:hypothetical protein